MRKQIVKNIGSNYMRAAAGMALGLFLIPFLIHKLGKEAFGLIVLAESTIAFFEVGTLGVRMALSRYASFALAKSDDKEFTQYLSTGRVLLAWAAVLVFIAAFSLSMYFPVIFKVPQELASQSRILFLLITVAFTFSVPNIVFWSVLYAKQRFDLINTSLFLGLLVRAVGIFVLFSVLPARHVSLVTYGVIYLFMTLVQNYLIYFWQKKIMPGIRIRLSEFRWHRVREILAFSFHTTLSRVSALFSSNLLDVMINLFWGPVFNAIYSVGFKFPLLMNRLFQDATWTLTPSFTELAAKNEHEKLKRLFFIYTRLIAILVAPLGLLLSVLAGPLIRLWVGDGFELAAKVLMVSALPLVSALPFATATCLFMAYGKVKVPSQVSFLVAVLHVGLAVLLGKVFSLGLVGIAISSAAASVCYFTFFAPYYACRVAGISLAEYWTYSFLKPFSWSVFVAGISLLLLKLVSHGRPITVAETVLTAVLVPLISYAGSYFFVLDSKERMGAKGMWREMTRGFQGIFKKPPLSVPKPL